MTDTLPAPAPTGIDRSRGRLTIALLLIAITQLTIVLAAIPRIAAIGDQPRVGDGLRMHPEMTSE